MAVWQVPKPPRTGWLTTFPRRRGHAASDNQTSAADRFETEAMPHLNDIFRTATRILGDRARAEDVAQEVYLQAWKSFHRFEPGTNCRAWLFKILFHCVNHHRRKWFRFPLLKETEEFIEANLTYAEPIPEHLTDRGYSGCARSNTRRLSRCDIDGGRGGVRV